MAVPPGAVAESLPVAPLPATAVMVVGESTVKLAAAVPPMLISLTWSRLVPVIVTNVPLPPLVGVKELILGAP